jgi:hypothetical protein
MTRILISAATALLMFPSWQACAQSLRCPEPTSEFVIVPGSASSSASKNIATAGDVNLQGMVQNTIENLWADYPQADRIAIAQNLLSTSCYFLRDSNLTGEQKFDRWLKVLEVFTVSLPIVKKRSTVEPTPVVQKPAVEPPTNAFPCQERQVIVWLEGHGVYGRRLDTSIYDGDVDWIVNGKVSSKTPSEIAKEEENFRKVYPVQQYTALTSSTAMVRGQCVLTQKVQSYKRRSNGREEHGAFKVVFAMRIDASRPRIVAQTIEVLRH